MKSITLVFSRIRIAFYKKIADGPTQYFENPIIKDFEHDYIRDYDRALELVRRAI